MGKSKQIVVSAVQMDCEINDKHGNLDKAMDFLQQFKDKTDMVCFPELFTTGYNIDLMGERFNRLAETIPGETTDLIGQKAKEYGVAVLGAIVEKDKEGRLYDTAFIINKKGELIGRYRKSHLYPREYQYFYPGSELPVFELAGVKIGIAICFEHAFPPVFTTLALKGAQLIFIPSAVPVGYEYLLNLRTRARAQDNQLFVAAVNLVGQEGEVRYCGLSQLINPKGEIITQASTKKEEILTSQIDLSLIEEERKQEPVLENLRPELYDFRRPP